MFYPKKSLFSLEFYGHLYFLVSDYLVIIDSKFLATL